ncbi:Uncharacterised protein [Mycobacteroides abscessus subsp. abscessus]|nr:Uncharacterised protein [Mycobacteroides abscessus subsp. abscessus]
MSPSGSCAGVSRTMLIDTLGSTSVMFIVGGAVRVSSALTVKIASTAPAPPRRWPVIDFVPLTRVSSMWSPRSSAIATDSGMSPTGVDVAWALTCLMSAGVSPPASSACSIACSAYLPSGSLPVMW